MYSIHKVEFNSICFSIDFPEKVSNLTAEMITINTISISWIFQLNGSSPRNRVGIEVRNEGVSVYNVTEEAFEVASTLFSLSPLRTYIISVYVVSSVGRSRPSSIEASTLSLSKTL